MYFKINNNGTDTALSISNITSSNTVFSLNRTSLSIAPSGLDSVLVTFAPTTNASFSDSLKITSNDPRNPISTVYLIAYSGNYTSGVITSNTTWTKANSPYIINGNLAIDPGWTLTLQNGTQVIFNGSYTFNIDGTLQANGLSGDSVVIMGVTSGIVYPGINLRNGATVNLAYTKVQNATAGVTTQSGTNLNIQNSRLTGNTTGLSLGYISGIVKKTRFDNNGTGIQTSNSALLTADSLVVQLNTLGVGCGNSTTSMTNSSISNNSGDGISDGGSGGSLTVNNCQINSNTSNGVNCSSLSTVNVTNSRLTSNGLKAVYVGNGGASGSITGDSIRSNGSGIISNSSNDTIANNNVTLNTGTGIQTSSSYNIANNIVISNGGSYGIYSTGTGSLTNNIVTFNTGIGIWAATNASISFNTVSNNGGTYGLYSSGNASITNNIVIQNTGTGIQTSSSNTIANNTVTNNGSYGIYSSGSSASLTNNIVTSNTGTGIWAATNASISSNTVTNNFGSHGIYSSGTGSLINNTVTSNTGIGIWAVASTSISSNTVTSNGGSYGIYSSSSSVSLINNIVTSNTGIGIWAATNANISFNKITNSGSHGMVLNASPNITNNDILNNNGDGVQVSSKPTFSYNRIYGNTGYAFNATLQAQDSIIARNNYWGLTTDVAISNVIHDYYDDAVTVKVLYKPYFTKPILPPQSLAALSTVGQMKLTWIKGNSPSNLMRYRIYGGTSSAPTTKMDSTSNPTDTMRVLTGLSPATTYYFRMTAVDSTGLESDYSSEINCVQLPLVQVYTVTPGPNQNNVLATTQITARIWF